MKNCPYCGTVYPDDEECCGLCGTKLETETEPKRSLCTASLVFGILGCFMLLPLISPLAALFTGRAALKQGESRSAAAGIVLSVISLSFTVLIAALYALWYLS